MQPTLCAGGKAPVTVLPEAGRESQMARWGIPREHVGEVRRTESDELDAALDGGGWHVVDYVKGRGEGITQHVGVLAPGEYVDGDVLRYLLEERLGFTMDAVASVFRQGRKSADQLALRDRIDARLLEVAEAGGSKTELARALGWPLTVPGAATNPETTRGPRSKTLERALARARAARSARVAVAA